MFLNSDGQQCLSWSMTSTTIAEGPLLVESCQFRLLEVLTVHQRLDV